MDTQNRKVSYERVLPHSFAIGNNNARQNNIVIPTRTNVHNRFDDGGRSYLKNFKARDSVDNIIQKYKNEKFKQKCNKYGDHNLNRSKGEHALFQGNLENKHSVQNCFHYVRPEILSTSNNKEINISINKHNRTINKNIASKVTFAEPISSIHKKMEFCERTSLTSREKLHADKTTYCRPVVSLFNEEFIYKTMERNMKLKQLLKKLAIERNREKESVTWNNFINELKNKHSLSCYRWTHLLPHESEQYIQSETIDYYANNRSSSQQSRPCRLLLQDLYKGCYHQPQTAHTYYQNNTNNNEQSYYNYHSSPYTTDSHCYPTSSQGRLMVLERERQKAEHQRHLKNDNFKYENNYKYKNYSERNLARKEYSRNSYSFKHNDKNISNRNSFESIAIQTNHYFDREEYKNNTENVYINKCDELIQICDNNKKTEEKYHFSANNIKKLSFKNIDNKIESLISTINNFINEIKLSRKLQSEQKANAVLGTPKSCNYKKTAQTSISKSDGDGKVGGTKRDELICGGKFNDTFINTWPVCNFRPCSKPSQTDDLMTRNDKFCSKGNSTFKGQPCSVNITFEVPTRDCSTEVTKSLYEHHCDDKIETIEEISTCDHTPIQQMTIAVNTDPFNFLTLLRISTQALMRLLSNVPYLNYHSYLALFPFPQISRTAESHYICNICGAAFNKPSALSEHIQEHNLGKTRDCCVCRHVLETSKSPRSLFKCKFCGQVFTRAYCCELHQKCCGQSLGFTSDVPSSLMLLR